MNNLLVQENKHLEKVWLIVEHETFLFGIQMMGTHEQNTFVYIYIIDRYVSIKN